MNGTFFKDSKFSSSFVTLASRLVLMFSEIIYINKEELKNTLYISFTFILTKRF